MKRVILIMLALITFVLVNAQNYKVDFSVNKEKAIANYQIKNCTKYDLYLVRTHDANLSAGCHCAINYENKDDSSYSINIQAYNDDILIENENLRRTK